MKKRTILIAKEKRQAKTTAFQFMKKIEVHLYQQIFKIEMIVCLCSIICNMFDGSRDKLTM